MALNNKHDGHNDNAHRKTSNVRQLPSSHQNQILSALDTLGAKLVRSETERETMRRLLNEALDAQERLENQLERSHIDIQRRMDKVEEGSSLSEETQSLLNDHQAKITQTYASLDDYNDRQMRLEDKLRDSQQTIAKLQRRIDSQEQKRAKLQRRIERVENIAADAQNALEAKALVLLTDQSQQVQALPSIDASAPIEALQTLHQDNVQQENARSLWKQNTSIIPIVALLALALGWMMALAMQPSEKAFVVTSNGELAQVDIQSGIATPITFNSEPRLLNVETIPETENNLSLNTTIEDDLALFSTDWVTDDILETALDEQQDIKNNADEIGQIVTPADLSVTLPELTMDRDLSLPADVKMIEDKAFNNIAEAQHDLAALYTMGEAGVTQNYERASYWFTQAAAQGIANAAYNLGVLFHQGLGQEQDMDRALDWYRRAAQLGHPEAQYNLGIAYIEGISTRYNPNMAAAFFQQAAIGGIAEAAYNLGLILENGLLGEVRAQDALQWYRGAAQKGNAEAEQALTALASRLGITEDEAGFLESGQTVADFMGSENTGITDVSEEVSLGSLVPSREQIIIAQIQEQLRKMKYYNGPQDGIVGSGTVQAIKSYQIREGLPADGQATESLLTHMLSNGTTYY
jgi:localization factor PodJL